MKALRHAAVATVFTLGLASAAVPVVAATSAAPSWRVAHVAALPSGATGVPQGYLPVLSCVSAGNCEAGGAYSLAKGNVKALVLTERAGVWRAPTTLVAPTNAAASAALTISGLSCGALGYCAATGSYNDRAGDQLAFVANEVAGHWRRALEVTLPANAVVSGQVALVRSVSCVGDYSCSAVGAYLDATTPISRNLAFVVDDVAGHWRGAQEVTPSPSANFNPFMTLNQVACAAAGRCVAIGSYINAHDVNQGLLVDQVNGAWGPATALVPPPDASAYAGTGLDEVTCVARASCVVVGTYYNAAGAIEALGTAQRGATWARASQLRMPSDAATNPHAFLYGFVGIACASAGNCSVGGQYETVSHQYEGFFINEVRGVWHQGVTLALPAGGQSAGKNGGVVAMSCPALGQCRAGAAYLDDAGRYQALVVNETGGVWQRGESVVLPGGASSVGVDGGMYALVCATPSVCTGTGSYLKNATTYEGFTLNS